MESRVAELESRLALSEARNETLNDELGSVKVHSNPRFSFGAPDHHLSILDFSGEFGGSYG